MSSYTTAIVSITACLAHAPKKCTQSGNFQFDIKSPSDFKILSARKLKTLFQKYKLALTTGIHACISHVLRSFLVRKVENKSFPCSDKLGERTGQVSQDSSRRVRTREKNSGETVRRLGSIIQSIFCAQSGAGIRLNFWK